MIHVLRLSCPLLVACLLVVRPGAALAQSELAIKGGRILPVVGDPIDDGVILVREGKIAAVGKDLAIPVEARVIDASGKTIVPGLVEAHSSSGMSQANETNPNVPFLSVVDSIDPGRDYFEECRRNGVTTAAVVPGNSTMIGGQAAIVKTAGSFVDQMILRRQAGLKMSLRPTSGASRMSHYAKLRVELEKARRANAGEKVEAVAAAAAAQNNQGDENQETDEPREQGESAAVSSGQTDPATQLAALRKLVAGELPAFIYCENAMDVVQAFRLQQQYQLKPILVLGADCDRAVDLIAESKLPVVLDENLVFWRTDPRTEEDQKIVLPRVFLDEGIPFTFQVSQTGGPALGSSYLWYQAAVAVKYGMTPEEALRALTLRPAEMIGVAEFVGSIEVGKDADLVILSGDPLRVETWVEQTIVSGEVVYDRAKDRVLQKLLAPDETQSGNE